MKEYLFYQQNKSKISEIYAVGQRNPSSLNLVAKRGSTISARTYLSESTNLSSAISTRRSSDNVTRSISNLNLYKR